MFFLCEDSRSYIYVLIITLYLPGKKKTISILNIIKTENKNGNMEYRYRKNYNVQLQNINIINQNLIIKNIIKYNLGGFRKNKIISVTRGTEP